MVIFALPPVGNIVVLVSPGPRVVPIISREAGLASVGVVKLMKKPQEWHVKKADDQDRDKQLLAVKEIAKERKSDDDDEDGDDDDSDDKKTEKKAMIKQAVAAGRHTAASATRQAARRRTCNP